jgi:hypothetical protein
MRGGVPGGDDGEDGKDDGRCRGYHVAASSDMGES